MQFNSLHFVLFFAIVLAAVAASRRHVRTRNAILLVASYYFYGCWDYRFLSLIVISTVIDYLAGRLFNEERTHDQPPQRTRKHRAILAVSIASNLGILCFFKYFDFFVVSASSLLESLGVQVHVNTLNVVLPVGISFYTFQTMSYTIDLYRGQVTTERSLLNFAVYVAYFPQLVAGPIERARHLLPQVRTPHVIDWARLNSGFFLIGWGLFKKVVIADNLAVIVDLVFASDANSGLSVVLGIYAFAIQIYCDFSGYVDIARGSARCMGFDLMRNFNLPYFATNPSDFWRRWHISLSTWLRDYLYIPLGGNRRGRRRTYINLLLTMILGGLWHGAAWTFVLWGVYHGLLLCIHRAAGPWLKALPAPESRLWTAAWFWLRVAGFFQLTCLGWLLFRAESVEQVASMLTTVASGGIELPGWTATHVATFASCSSLFALVQLMQWHRGDLNFVLRLPAAVRVAIYVAGIVGFIFFGNFHGGAFIYFQF